MSAQEYNLLQEQLKGITTLLNAQFGAVNERLDKINGNVAHHETEINEALIERAQNREEQRHNFELLKNNSEELKTMKKDLADATFIIRHPRLFIAALVIITLLTLATFLENGSKFFKTISIEPPQTEQTK